MIFNPNMRRHWSRKYDDGFEGHTLDSTLIEAALKKSLVDGSVFEIGAGTGYFTKVMEGWGYDVSATDLVVGDTMDIAKERRGEYDNVVAIGVLHHLLDGDDHRAALENIKAMAKKRIVIAVKLPSSRLKPRSRHMNRYPLTDYTDVLGSPVTMHAGGYLSVLKWEVGADSQLS